MINKQICINDVLDGGVPCSPYELQWIIPNDSCIASPCDGCTTDCIDVTVLDECEYNSIQVIVTCPSCGACDPVIKTITFCNTEGDCSGCEDCVQGLCESKCEDFCDEFGTCVECLNAANCPGDQECIQGGCQCPPGTTDIGNGVCRECTVDGDCPDCTTCNGAYCVPKQCFGKPCVDDECVECTNSSHCGTNETCNPDNTCSCSTGYVRDVLTGQCVPSPECNGDEECPPCYNCMGDGCSPTVCPEGYTCYQDECVEKCNCLNPTCDGVNSKCVNLGFGGCVCLPCEGDCPDPNTPGTGTEPDPENPNNPGTDCSVNGDCPSGMKCVDGGCVPCDGPCPDGSGGTYENCVENFVINKDDMACAVEGILETTTPCNCDVLTWSTEVYSRSNGQMSFRIRLRKGNAFEQGLNNIPLLGNTGIINELPDAGHIEFKVTEIAEYLGDSSSSKKNIKTDGQLSFVGVDTIITSGIKLKEIGEVCLDVNSGEYLKITQILVEFSIPTFQLSTPNGCVYGTEKTKISYTVNENGGNGFYSEVDFFNTTLPLVQYDTIQANNNRNPILKWYRLNSPLETGGTLIRSAYADKVSDFKFRDAWNGILEGFEIQKYYRLESDCACSGHTFFECNGAPAKLFYCNPDISSLNYSLVNCNTNIEFTSNSFAVCDANQAYPQVYDLYLNGVLKDSFTPVGGILSINGSYVSATPIQTIEIKLQGLDCEDCGFTIDVTSSALDIVVDSYDCTTDELNVSISGGSGNYIVEIDDVVWTPGTPIDIISGPHTIDVFDTTTECEVNENFDVDCCLIFALNAPDVNVCGASMTTYDFSVSGGEANYTWEVRDFEGGTILDNNVSTTENITADLTGYAGTSFWVEVTDNKACVVEKTVFVTYVSDVAVTVSNTEYCIGDTSHEVEITRVSGLMPFSFDLKQGGVSQQTGSLTMNTDHILIADITGGDVFSIELTDGNGCTAIQGITLTSAACPDPVISAEDKEVCTLNDLIIEASISSGTGPYDWTITGDFTDSGMGAVIASNQGPQAQGTYNFVIFVTDSNSKTDSVPVEYIVGGPSDPICNPCPSDPEISISSSTGWHADVGESVTVTYNYPSAVSQEWFVNGVSKGSGIELYPDTSTEAALEIYAIVEFVAGCTTSTDTQTLIVSAPCTCSVGIGLTSGWGDDNGSTITTNSVSSSTGCTGDQVTMTGVPDSCVNVGYSWKIFRNGGLQETGNTNVHNYTPVVAGTYRFELYGVDDVCSTPIVTFTKDFIDCRTCTITSDPIVNESICDGQTFNSNFHIHNKWPSSNIVRTIKVNGANYGSPVNLSCVGSTDCSSSFSLSGIAVGSWSVVVRGAEADDLNCYSEETFTLTVMASSHPECQDCGDNSGSVSIVGATCVFGNCWIDVTEDQPVNISGSATGSPGNFTYQWKTTGGTNVGIGSSVSVGPFNYGQDTTYVLHATDEEGCVFSQAVELRPAADCSGSISQSFTATSGCQGDPITMTWDITGLAHYQDYVVRVRRASSTSGPYSLVFTGDWNDSYNFSVASSSRYYYIDVSRHNCQKQLFRQEISVDPCIDCTGTVSSIGVSSGGTVMCPYDTRNLTANVSGDTGGWTYTWRRGTSSGGAVLGSGLSLNGYSPNSLPESVRVWYSKTGCEGVNGYKQVNFTEAAGCCPDVGSIQVLNSGGGGSNDTSRCKGEAVRLTLTNYNPLYTYTWRENNSGGAVIDTGYPLQYTKLTNGSETIWVGAEKSGCPGDSASVVITEDPSCCPDIGSVLVVNPGGGGGHDPSRCKNEQTELRVSNYNSGYTYTWRRNNSGGSLIGVGYPMSYTKTTNGSEVIWVGATKANCPGDNATMTITEDPTCCPTVLGDGMVSQPSWSGAGFEACIGEPIEVYVHVDPSIDPSYSFRWYKGQTPTGTVISTNQILTWEKISTGTEYITGVVSHPDCPDIVVTKGYTLSSACCPTSNPIISSSNCTGSGMTLTVSNTTSYDKIKFNSGSWLTGGVNRSFNVSSAGLTTVTITVTRDYCNDPLVYTVNVQI